MRQTVRFTFPLLLILILGSGTGLAQSINAGDIRGTVTDSTGALIPGVTVTVRNVDTGIVKTLVTNRDGLYDTSSIVAGNYTVTFSKTGFEQLVRGPITLQVGFTTVNGQLKVGSTTTQVTVTTDVPLLQTESGDQTATLDAKAMEQLPQTGQDWENFMILMPGATGAPGSDQGSSSPGQTASVNGSLPYNNIIADGASTTLEHSQNANTTIFQDTGELQVSLSSFSAQYGVGGAVVNEISKGGTSQFHGSAYDFLQNDKFDAAGYGFASHPTVPYLRYNNFGGNIGGPIDIPLMNLKKKAFFFFGYDQIVDHGSASNATNSIPSTAEMQGVFTGELPIYDPTTQTIAYDPQGNPYPVRQSFQSEYGSNAIPSGMFDTVAKAFEQFFPTPSNHIAGGKFIQGTVGSDGEIQNNFYSSVPQSSPLRRYFGRLDYDITSNNRLTMSDTQTDSPIIYPSAVTPCPIGCEAGDVDNNNAQVTDVWNISSRTINEARMGYTWQGNFFNDLSLGKGYASKLGWQFAKADDFPAIQFYRNYPYAWIQPSSNAVYKEHVFDPSDVITMIRGKHILHFGGELLFYRDDSTEWGNTNAGTLSFNGSYTEEWDHAACGSSAYVGQMCPDGSTGLEYADFLLGLSSGWSAGISPEYGARFKSPQLFIQDDYKVHPNLTVNLGLRYQFNTGWSEIRGNEASFDPTVANPAANPFTGQTNTRGAYWFGTTHANGRNNLIAGVYNTWLPRFGASWQPKPNMTVRGAIGLYAYTWSLDNYGGNNSSSGFGAALASAGSDSDQTNGITPLVQLDGKGTLYGTTTPLPYKANSTSPAAYNGQGIGFISYHVPVPRMMEWNFGVQRQFGSDFMAEASWVGSHGSNLIFNTDINAIPQQDLGPNDVAQGYRPYPLFQSITGSSNNGISNYNSLQIVVSKRMTHGFSYSASYVWSHMLDSQDSSGWGGRAGAQNWQIANDVKANYSNSNFDVRHALKGYAVYTLPFGHGQPYLHTSRVLDEILGGWQISGTAVEMTGQPFTVTASNSNSYQQAGSVFPNWNPGVSWKPQHQSARCEAQSGGGCVNEWYNPAAFTEPANGTFGDVRRNPLYGPGLNQVNLSGGKIFSVWENTKLDIRVDATNAFNHPSFSLPNGGLSGAIAPGDPYAFGENSAGTGSGPTQQISGTTVGGRTVQFGAKLTF